MRGSGTSTADEGRPRGDEPAQAGGLRSEPDRGLQLSADRGTAGDYPEHGGKARRQGHPVSDRLDGRRGGNGRGMMSSVERKSSGDARRKARAQASAWVVRLHGPHRSPALEAGFCAWLAADSEHARQFERVTDVWDAGPQVSISGVPRMRAQRRLPASRIWAAAAAMALVCLVAAYFFVGVRSGTVYRNGIGPLRVIQLEDGSRLSLDAQSEVRVAYGDTERRVQLEYGEAYFQVSHGPGWPFVVVAGQHQITDIGTAFMVRYGLGRTAVTLLEGRVAVSSRSVLAHGSGGGGLRSSRVAPIVLAPG